jgi:curved DNA-binding protein CbpA
MKNYYDILGVSQFASVEEIKTAYRKLSMKFHPDKNEGDIFFQERFLAIKEAYDVLSDSESREKYDEKVFKQNNTDNINSNHSHNYSNPKNQEDNNEFQSESNNYSEVGQESNLTNHYIAGGLIIVAILIAVFSHEISDLRYSSAVKNYVTSDTVKEQIVTDTPVSQLDVDTVVMSTDSTVADNTPDKTEYTYEKFDNNVVLVMTDFKNLKGLILRDGTTYETDQSKKIKVVDIGWRKNYDGNIRLDYISIKNLSSQSQIIYGVRLNYRLYNKNDQEVDSDEIYLGLTLDEERNETRYSLSIEPDRTKKISVEQKVVKTPNQKIQFGISRIEYSPN